MKKPTVKKSSKLVKPIRNAGIVKKYRASTLERIVAIVKRGQLKPKYMLRVVLDDTDGTYATVCYTQTHAGAVYVRRKARGFVRRILQRKLAFKIIKLSRKAK